MDAPAAQRPQRHFFIDLYRSAVILLMLEGHVVREFLSHDLQGGVAFQLHELIHGLSAPAFLFGAGLTFVISTKKRWQEYHHWGPQLARRVKRLLFILLLAFMIHLPYFSARKIIMDGTTADYLQFFQSDVLHCIGLGLLALHGLLFFFRSEDRFYGMVLVTICAVCLLTPLVWDLDALRYLPIGVAQLLNGNHGSVFPLFPFVGFLFAGVLVSWEFLVAVDQGSERQFMGRLVLIGLCAAGAGVLFDLVPVQVYPTYNFWYTSPNYFLIRLGALLCFLPAVWFASRWITSRSPFLTVFGRESLFVYVLHLLLLYGSAFNPAANLRAALGGGHSLGATLLLTLAVVGGCYACAVVWHLLKTRQFSLYRIVQLAAAAAFLYRFFRNDF